MLSNNLKEIGQRSKELLSKTWQRLSEFRLLVLNKLLKLKDSIKQRVSKLRNKDSKPSQDSAD
jgi:hypothetical protein